MHHNLKLSENLNVELQEEFSLAWLWEIYLIANWYGEIDFLFLIDMQLWAALFH